MIRRHRRILLAIAIAGIAIAVLAVAMQALFTPWLRATVEGAASRALGRELRIAGALGVSFALAPRLTAFDVTLANAPWGSEPSMVRAGRATLVLDLLSLRAGPIRVPELEIADVRLLLEADGEGRGNWVFSSPRAQDRPSGSPVELGRVTLLGLELVYRARPEAAPVTVDVGQLEAHLDPATRRVEVGGSGRWDRTPWELAGWLGTFDDLAAARPIDHELTGRLGDTTIEIRGRARDRLAPGQPNLEVAAAGPDLAAALERFGLRSPLGGEFRVSGRFTPAGGGVGVDLAGTAGGIAATARGVVRALATPDRFDLALEATAPDAAAVGRWIGLEGLPPRPAALAGRLRRAAGRLTLEDTTLRVGGTTILVAGALGAPPRFVGTDLSVRATGSDLAELSSITRLRLPPGPFEVAGRFRREEGGLGIDDAELRTGGARVRASGALGEPPRALGLDLTVDATGPDSAPLARLAGIALPPGPFALSGRVARDGPGLALDAVEARIDDHRLSASGRLAPVRGLVGTDLELRVGGSDLAGFLSVWGLDGLPAVGFDAGGRLRIAASGYELAEVEGTVGRLAVALSGRLAAPSLRDGTTLSGRVDGPALTELAAWGLAATLPAEPFSVAGTIRLEAGVLEADDLVAQVGSDRAHLDGVLGSLPRLSEFDADVDLAGPNLAALDRFLASAEPTAPAWLPADDYALAGRIRRLPSGVELRGVRARVGRTTGRFDGTLGSGAGGRDFDLRFEAAGPDASLLSRLAGVTLPTGALAASGRLARAGADLRLEELAVTVGGMRAGASGIVGLQPDRAGTDLRIDLAGPDLAAAFSPVPALATLPAEAFELSLELAGGTGRLVSRRFSARWGSNDLTGSLALRLGARPGLEADLRSRRLDLSQLLGRLAAEPAAGQTAAPAAPLERLLSDQPFELGYLRRLDATLRLEAGELALPRLALRDVVLAGELRDGALRIDRLEATGAEGGRISASLTLEPAADAYRIRAAGRIADARFGFAMKDPVPADFPVFDLEFDLQGEGRSLHALAASGSGRALMVVGPGRIPRTFSDRARQGPLRALLEALNPFRKTAEHTEFECGIAFAELTGGEAVLDPLATRTAQLTVVGQGRIDFASEAIDLSWTLKPRQGVGISASSITNPYVKLGGSLAAPSLDLKPLSAITSMGAAVATGGLTVVSSGLYNRITAERKVCVDALADARQQMKPAVGAGGP